MPLTPLHLVPAWAIFLTARRRWSFAGLSAGAMIPDVEIPILFVTGIETQTGHGIMHSLIGALTLDVVVAVFAIFLLYPTMAGWWEGRFGNRWIHFGGVDVGDIDRLHRVVAGVYIGVLLHISLDFLTHTWMPYPWPYSDPVNTFSFARDFWWMVLVNAVLFVILLALIRAHLGRLEDATVGK